MAGPWGRRSERARHRRRYEVRSLPDEELEYAEPRETPHLGIVLAGCLPLIVRLFLFLLLFFLLLSLWLGGSFVQVIYF